MRRLLLTLLFLTICSASSILCFAGDSKDDVNGNLILNISPNQTSGSLLIKRAEQLVLSASSTEMKKEAENRYLLLFDVYIKARSYAILNKIFFWLSVVAGLGVLIWPSLSIIFKNKLEHWEWVKSATVQTTVTGIAALTFTMYSQYKDKQTYAETLMRYITYSEQDVPNLSIRVAEELARIDRGFSFNSLINSDNPN